MRIKYRFTNLTDAGYTQVQYWQKWNPFSYLRCKIVGFIHGSFITMEQRHQGIQDIIRNKVNKSHTMGEFTI